MYGVAMCSMMYSLVSFGEYRLGTHSYPGICSDVRSSITKETGSSHGARGSLQKPCWLTRVVSKAFEDSLTLET
jgi:hypothetical protein